MSQQRIKHVRLQTAVSLTQMRQFYHSTLGLAVLAENGSELTLAAGQTTLTFVHTTPENGHPFYHFAFDIPENKILAAYHWQRPLTPLLPLRPEKFAAMHDPQFPDEVVYLPDWNAHAIYFLDPAGSLVEYCARHSVPNQSEGAFSSQDLRYISEVGFVVNNIDTVAADVVAHTGLGHYRGTWTIGDEYGLILLLRQATPWGSVVGERPKGVFPTAVTLYGKRPLTYPVPNYPYTITIENRSLQP